MTSIINSSELIINVDNYNQALDVYNTGQNSHDWWSENQPDENLIYKNGINFQLSKFSSIVDIVKFELLAPKICSSHTSKSVKLPVACFNLNYYRLTKAVIFIRDNFHDIKLSVIANCDIKLPYNEVHNEITSEEYEKTKQKSREYRGCSYSEEEYANDSWYKKYSGNTILRKDNKRYIAYTVSKVYCEGINKLNLPNKVFRPYITDSCMFSICLASYAKLAYILEIISHSLSRTQMWTSYPELIKNE